MAEDPAREVVLQKYLSRRLGDEPFFEKALPSVDGAGTLRAKSLKEALLDRQCDLAVLRAIKDDSKKRSAIIASGSTPLVATTVYYAAIAAALVHHGQRISKYSYENLAERFFLLTQRSWIDRELQDLFTRAASLCRQARTNR